MSTPVALIAVGLLASVIFNVVWVTAQLVLAPWARLAVDEVRWGFGPRLFSFAVRGTKIDVCAFPIGASSTPRGMNPYTETEPETPEAPLVLWNDASSLRRAVMMFAPSVLVLCGALLVLGSKRFFAAFLSSVPDYFAALGGDARVTRSSNRLARRVKETTNRLVMRISQILERRTRLDDQRHQHDPMQLVGRPLQLGQVEVPLHGEQPVWFGRSGVHQQSLRPLHHDQPVQCGQDLRQQLLPVVVTT